MKVTVNNIHNAFELIKIGHVITYTKSVTFKDIEKEAKRHKAEVIDLGDNTFRRYL